MFSAPFFQVTTSGFSSRASVPAAAVCKRKGVHTVWYQFEKGTSLTSASWISRTYGNSIWTSPSSVSETQCTQCWWLTQVNWLNDWLIQYQINLTKPISTERQSSTVLSAAASSMAPARLCGVIGFDNTWQIAWPRSWAQHSMTMGLSTFFFPCQMYCQSIHFILNRAIWVSLCNYGSLLGSHFLPHSYILHNLKLITVYTSSFELWMKHWYTTLTWNHRTLI